jgi:hypothetical protein
MNNWDKDTTRFAGAIIGLVVVWLIFYLFLAPAKVLADNLIAIDQIGSYNTVVVTQDGTTQATKVSLGKDSAVDNTYVNITQQGTGNKVSSVEIPSGYNNSVIMFQDGAGNHSAAIQNLNGAANNINFSQTGAGNHSMTVAGAAGTTNSGDTINSTQSGSGDKSFQLNLNGTSGATVNIQQTNPTTPNTGSMTIQCMTCGTYNYTRQ